MPVRNAIDWIDAAMQSVVGQTYAGWELVAVNDGSSDGSTGVLGNWAQRDPRIQVIESKARGFVAALNTGLEAARGEFVARMDADDTMTPDRLARQIGLLDADPGLSLVGGRVEFGGDAEAQAGYAAHVDWLNETMTEAQIRRARFVESPLAHPSVMFRRAWWAQSGGYRDGDFPEDYELWLRWLDAGARMAKVPATVLVWRDSPKRLSRTDPRYDPEAFYRIKAKYLARELARSGGERAVWIAGAGRPTRKRAELLCEHGVEIAGYLDVDPRKIGQLVNGRPVVAVQDLPSPHDAVVLSYVANRGAREKVCAMLVAQDRVEGWDFWLCA